MSRALFITCALLAGAVVWFRTTAPDCAGWYCLALDDKPVAAQVIQSNSLAAAKRETAGNKPRPSVSLASPAFEAAAEPLDQPAAEPEASPAPLRKRPAQVRQETAFDDLEFDDATASAEIEADTPARRVAIKKAAREAANAWESLVATALEEPDPVKRGAAIGDLGLHRNDDAVAVLLEVATFESDPDNRYQAVQSLWYSAADGLDADGGIRSVLQTALGDPDEQIAEMAEKALADLKALEAAE